MEIKDSNVEIHTIFRCNNYCVFCSIKKRPCPDPSKETLKENILTASGCKRLILSGGEPTLRKDFLELVKYARKFHKLILLETNGANKEYLEKIIKKGGIKEIRLAIHGDNERTHDRITRNKGSFDKICKTLDCLKKFNGLKIITNTVINKFNVYKLPSIVKWIEKKYPFVSCIQLSYARFYKFSDSKRFTIPLPEIKKYVNKAIKYSNKIVLENIPLCVVNSKYAKNYDWNIKLAVNGIIVYPLDKRVYSKKCKLCKLKRECQEIHNFYHLYYDLDFIKPFV